ncbi:MAG: prepilin-type N-terminal cleavage/methylation domain-containing protein [Thermodesulfovibrionales bacterium]
MKQRGFSLIEIIVVMAIVAILAGIMVPFAYKAWESADIDTTKERLSALKKAMVGDNKLVQNGVRTDFGFIGQSGQLPDTLAELVSGGYIGAGFDPSKVIKDAWGEDIVYTPVKDASDRWASASLRSKGADRTTGTTDDIVLPVDIFEVTPTASIKGNITITFSTPPQNVYNYSAKVRVEYKGAAGAHECSCIPISIGGSPGNTQVIYPGVGFNCTASEKLPAGPMLLRALLFSNGTCGASKKIGEDTYYNLNDRASSIIADLQVLAVDP